MIDRDGGGDGPQEAWTASLGVVLGGLILGGLILGRFISGVGGGRGGWRWSHVRIYGGQGW